MSRRRAAGGTRRLSEVVKGRICLNADDMTCSTLVLSKCFKMPADNRVSLEGTWRNQRFRIQGTVDIIRLKSKIFRLKKKRRRTLLHLPSVILRVPGGKLFHISPPSKCQSQKNELRSAANVEITLSLSRWLTFSTINGRGGWTEVVFISSCLINADEWLSKNHSRPDGISLTSAVHVGIHENWEYFTARLGVTCPYL